MMTSKIVGSKGNIENLRYVQHQPSPLARAGAKLSL